MEGRTSREINSDVYKRQVIYRLLRTSVHTRLRERGIDPNDPKLEEPLPEGQEPGQQRLEDV